MLPENCKLKQWDTTIPIGIAKSRKVVTGNSGEDVEQQELLFIGSGNAKQYKYFERQFGSFLQSYT